jgi:hypothetical protein
MKKLFLFLGILLVFSSCGPSLCDCANYKSNDDEACKRVYKTHLLTEDPSFIRLESVRKNCKD